MSGEKGVLLNRSTALKAKQFFSADARASTDRSAPFFNRNALLAHLMIPAVIETEWELDEDFDVYKCKVKQCVKAKEGYEPPEDAIELDLYDPCGTGQPSPVVGDKVFAVFRGVWEMVSSPSGSSAPVLYAVVMEAIRQTGDVTSEPEEYTYGKIRVIGKNYPTTDANGDPIEPKYDDCACLYLADTEVAVVGLVVEVQGPFKRENPDFNPEEDESEDNPKEIEYYSVANWGKEWVVEMGADVQGGESFIAAIHDLAGLVPEAHSVTVWANHFYTDTVLKGGVDVRIKGEAGGETIKLQIIGYEGCPSPVEEEEEETP